MASSKSFPEQLELALWRMNYLRQLRVDEGSWTKTDWRASLKEEAINWNQTDHVAMVAFLKAGGYAPAVVPKDAILVDPITGESIELEMPVEAIDAVDFDGLEAALPPPPSQLSPDHELEEIVQAAALSADPRLGSW